MHFSSEIAELLREWAQLRAEMERLHCQFKALHDHSVEAGLQSMKTRAGSLLHEIQARLKAKNSPPSKPKSQKLVGFLPFEQMSRPVRKHGCTSREMRSAQKGYAWNFSAAAQFFEDRSEEWLF